MLPTRDEVDESRNDFEGGLWHVVLTQFSYRGYDLLQRQVDPLSPHRLDFRFEIFELACAPSVLAQTNQRFDWIIIIDKSLSEEYRKRLLNAVRHRPRTYLHEFSRTEDIGGSAWLGKYAPGTGIKHLVTTLLDDDDTLPVNFIDAIQSEVKERFATLPHLMTFGYKSSLEWDLISTIRAPFGYKYPWHRGDWVRSAGFSMLSRPEDDVSVFSLAHFLGDVWFTVGKLGTSLKWDDSIKPEQYERIEKRRDAFQARANIEAAVAQSRRQGGPLFVELSGRTGPVVMTNHYFNDVVFRLLEPKPSRSRVTGRESFQNTVVEVEEVRRRSTFFKKRWRMYTKILSERGKLSPFKWKQRWRFHLAIWGAWRFVLL